LILPPPLREGELVAIVAPSSPFDVEAYRVGEAWLREHQRVVVRDDVLEARGYLAGDDARRLAELREAIEDREVRAIVAARGGYGATRIVDGVDWSKLKKDPKWIVGFSDVTALHVEASRVGVAGIHASMLANLGKRGDADRTKWLDFMRGSYRSTQVAWRDLDVVVAGSAKGVAFGGNLALLESCAAAGRLVVPKRAVLFIEDCTERPYRIDRMLTALRLGRHFARVAAIVLGEFTECGAGKDGVTIDEVLVERLSSLGVPVVAGAPFGHGDRNEPWIVGAEVEVDARDERASIVFAT
jgi:muramoyltetrapeptide carboxypeptidase